MRALVRSGFRRRRKPTGLRPAGVLSARPLPKRHLRRNLSAGRDSPRMAHLLFLSHAGADTERALRLAAAIEASPEAQQQRPRAQRMHLPKSTPWRNLCAKKGPVLC